MSRDAGMFKVFDGPLAVVRTCLLCKHADVRRKHPAGRAPLGRGQGMSEGNKQRGRMIAHFKAEHPDAYAALYPKQASEEGQP